MTEAANESDASLLFEWAPLKREKFLITVFLIGSLLLHAVAFYVFRIIYPPAIALLPAPARVNLIAATSEEGRTLLRWIEAEDPALAFATLRPAESRSRALPKLTHVPSYMIQEPQLKEPPPFELVPTAPEAFPPDPIRVSRNPIEPWPKTPTRVGFSEELSGLGEIKLAAREFAGSTAEPPENVRFRIAVNPSGEIRYCFRLNSSGDSSLDEQARLWLIRSRFNPPKAGAATEEQNLKWGVATVEWGNDVTQPARSSTPAPP
jgi:outer membrane biosynthesis protein TonB